MRVVLGYKTPTPSAAFHDVYQNIEEYVTRTELDRTVTKTLAEMETVTRGRRCAFGWSGGKDSLVLAYLCEAAGIIDGIHCACADLEFFEVTQFCDLYRPSGVVKWESPLDIGWAIDNEGIFFTKAMHNAMTAKVTWAGQRAYWRENRHELTLYGRRRIDGNHIGSAGPYSLLLPESGYNQYNPLRDWPHEMILAAMHYYNLPKPPQIRWRDGWSNSSTFWCARNGWEEVAEIDLFLVRELSLCFAGAKEHMRWA